MMNWKKRYHIPRIGARVRCTGNNNSHRYFKKGEIYTLKRTMGWGNKEWITTEGDRDVPGGPILRLSNFEVIG